MRVAKDKILNSPVIMRTYDVKCLGILHVHETFIFKGNKATRICPACKGHQAYTINKPKHQYPAILSGREGSND